MRQQVSKDLIIRKKKAENAYALTLNHKTPRLIAVGILAFIAAYLASHTAINAPGFVLAIEIGGPITTTPPRHPIGAFESPPKILMEYNGKEYNGALRSYTFKSGDVNTNVPTSPKGPGSNLTSILPEYSVTVEKDSLIRFVIEGNPRPEF